MESIIELLMYIVSILSILGSWIVIKKNRYGFIIWMITNASWIVYDVYKTAYPQAVLMIVYFVMSLWGFITWKEDKNEISIN